MGQCLTRTLPTDAASVSEHAPTCREKEEDFHICRRRLLETDPRVLMDFTSGSDGLLSLLKLLFLLTCKGIKKFVQTKHFEQPDAVILNDFSTDLGKLWKWTH